ncbi:substrate-binding domain-containing protein [Deinococcus malanensis]|uniref:substrate-binding domain-containing protein n=1 Tax=Deinococcus malanensis TaxID=1706855 RepID=UPI00362BEB36
MATYNLTTLFHERRMRTQQPTVLVDAHADNVDCAYMDNVTGGRLAGEYASSLPGALYAIWVETELDQLFSTRVFEDRRSGFLEATQRAGRGSAVSSSPASTPSPRAILPRRCSTRSGPPRGLPATVFASADLLAGALLDEAHLRGLKVGEDLRIIGFDDQPWAAARGLTTLHQPVESMGYEAAQLLLSRLNGHRGPPRARRFEPTLICRETA